MRFIVYGVGAIGGSIAAALSLAGLEVAGIARGAQLEAIRDRGLLLRTPERTATARFECHADPAEIDFRDDDVILLTMKTQDTAPALERLRHAGVGEQPILCVQNGVANERMAIRFFPNVYGVTVMMPSVYLVPGEVNVFSVPRHGILEVGRYPSGQDDIADSICVCLERANFAAFPEADVMAGKHGKLLLNLRNIIEAALGPEAESAAIYAPVRREAEAVYKAAGIVSRDVSQGDPRRQQLTQQREIAGVSRIGGSSTQSLVRGSTSIETDYLNGEIVLLGRLHGVPTPANTWLCALGQRLISEGLRPGSVSADEMARGLGIG
jgi:2-dehydropantoate 2-reductase